MFWAGLVRCPCQCYLSEMEMISKYLFYRSLRSWLSTYHLSGQCHWKTHNAGAVQHHIVKRNSLRLTDWPTNSDGRKAWKMISDSPVDLHGPYTSLAWVSTVTEECRIWTHQAAPPCCCQCWQIWSLTSSLTCIHCKGNNAGGGGAYWEPKMY